jgi:hypothetical protein
MLRGANELYDFIRKKLEIGNKEVSADGVFSLEEVECIGACTGAPAMQVNYDFYENLTPSRTNQLLDQLDKERTPPVSAPITGAVHERHPAEVPVISRLFGVPDSHKSTSIGKMTVTKASSAPSANCRPSRSSTKSRNRTCAAGAAPDSPPA